MKLPFLKTGKLARNFFRFGSINYFFSRQNKNFFEPRFADCKTRKFRNLKSRTELLHPYTAIFGYKTQSVTLHSRPECASNRCEYLTTSVWIELAIFGGVKRKQQADETEDSQPRRQAFQPGKARRNGHYEYHPRFFLLRQPPLERGQCAESGTRNRGRRRGLDRRRCLFLTS